MPPYHPLVTQQGFDPAKVDAALRADAANIVKAGYNLKGKSTGPLSLGNLSYRVSNTDVNLVVLMGPEKNVTVLREQVRGTVWDGTGIGYGVRGSNRVDLTTRLQGKQKLLKKRSSKMQNRSSVNSQWLFASLVEIVEVYREQAPLAPILFDYSPSTARWAIEQRFPLPSNCTDSPGKSLVIISPLLSVELLS